MKVLVSWIGITDLRAARKGQPAAEPGPNLRLLRAREFGCVYFLNDVPVERATADEASPVEYCEWLGRMGYPVSPRSLRTTEPSLRNDYARAFRFTIETVEAIQRSHRGDAFTLHLSPGYAAAQVAMVLAAQTCFESPVELVNTSIEAGAEVVELPFLLSLEDLLPRALRGSAALAQAPGPAFEHLLGESPVFRAAVARAQHYARFERLPVLILGETGTGKEQFARAIHRASPRAARQFVAVNVAAVPETLLDSELFGHVRGAFTGANQARTGLVAHAEGGTLFLDEIGDLSPAAQIKLLRLLEERTYWPVGSDNEQRADVRILAATHVDLPAQIRAGKFREDLYHRLQEGPTLRLPTLRERGRDRLLLAEAFLDQWNREQGQQVQADGDVLADLARRPWYGNVRELKSGVFKLALEVSLWRSEPVIDRALLETVLGPAPTWVGSPLDALNAQDFACLLAAVVDELLARFRRPDGLPFELPAGADLFEAVLEPLVRGRALAATAGNAARAGLLFRDWKMDLSEGKTDRKHTDTYRERWAPELDEQRILDLRTGGTDEILRPPP
jgi:DNA-binding NtrC family response regulator